MFEVQQLSQPSEEERLQSGADGGRTKQPHSSLIPVGFKLYYRINDVNNIEERLR